MSQHILIIEDDQDIARLIALHLEDLCYRVEHSNRGDRGLAAALEKAFDLVILDLMLPELDGLEVCRRLRAASCLMPILMLTAKSSELDRVVGLEIGADDYLTKPFSVKELMARVKALLRRASITQPPDTAQLQTDISINGLNIDTARRQVAIDGKPVQLTAREFELLLYFAKHPGRVYSRTQLLDQVWGYGHDGYEHTVNSHINRLRKKIEQDPANARFIQTVWGVGYRFAEPEQG